MSRRQAMRFLITGGALLLEAGGLGAFTLGLAGKLVQSPHPSPPLLTGAMIGQTTQARNTARDFLNPRTGKQSLLIHLPDGSFVAYEKACTHKGVFVNYDPATHHLVCPAHGAIFDPAQQGKVVQGPAPQGLPQVALQLNGDGTITLK
jgi:Rieske Fe-S protein